MVDIEIQEWHLEDPNGLPVLHPLVNPKWRSYPEHKLFSWNSPQEPEFDPDAPGEMGKPVILDKARDREVKAKSSLHSLNLVATDLISLNRSLPDFRNPR